MYGDRFETDWETLTQEEAMFRAYALGVDAAFGNEYPDELQRLTREFHRGLIQIAFDEGKSRASDTLERRGHQPESTDAYEFEPSEYDWEIWDELVTERREEPDAFEMVRVERSRDSVPGSLDRPGLLDRSSDRIESVRLPRFLLR
jgi:hypothetical protein